MTSLRDLFGPLAEETSTWQGFKIWLNGYVPIGQDAMHVVLGAVIAALAVALARRRAAGVAFGIALAAGVGMELIDRRDDLAELGRWRWGESLSDVGLTVLVPLVLLAVGRATGRHRAVPPSSEQ